MLATLNAKQIVDEIVKDTVKDNDPHDAVQISPEIVLASRPASVSPALAPEIAPRPEPRFPAEPKLAAEPRFTLEPARGPEPTVQVVHGKSDAAPLVDPAVRVTSGDSPVRPERSWARTWLRGASVALLLAGTGVAASIAWEKHGDTARQMLAEWTPALTSLLPVDTLLPATSQTAAQAAPPVAEATADQAVDPSAAAHPVQFAAAAPAATQSVDAAQSVQSMTRDLAAMAQQIEQLKANIAELKAGQEQMVRELAKPPAPRAAAVEPRPVDPRARAATLPPQPAAPPVRKPKPAVTRTHMPASSPTPLAPPPPPSQAAAAPPPATTAQAVADDDGPIVRPPMPLR
ncbi:MAG TPA: hypothetical protein VNK51_26615 [Bradyrhizobium sp.]|nr:hypothetical protein [Bradyrhizobium sp.]